MRKIIYFLYNLFVLKHLEYVKIKINTDNSSNTIFLK